MKDDTLLLLESSDDDGGTNAHINVGVKMAASAADRRESLAMVDLVCSAKYLSFTD